MADLTPMVKQYQEIKSKHKDAILFYRLGDFYEMFNDDAVLASKELEITLTGRGEGESRMPMAGIPYHAADSYIARLINKGYKVAICEQMEEPDGKGPVRREVIKIITPGTVTEPNMLNEVRANFLAAVSFGKSAVGFAFIDASTGEFRATQIKDENAGEKLKSEIERVGPAEVLVPDIIPDADKGIIQFLNDKGISVTQYRDVYDFDVATDRLKEQFHVSSLDGFGMSDVSASLGAAAAIIEYLKDTQKSALGHINSIKPYLSSEFMFIDAQTRRNLEITQTIRDKSSRGSLLWVLDATKTAMGSRMLKNFVIEPLLDVSKIDERLDAVEELAQKSVLRMELEEELNNISDIERLSGRISIGTANARDLISLKESLRRLPKLKEILKSCGAKLVRDVLSLNDPGGVIEKIGAAIVEDPPLPIKEGGIIKDGYNAELDELKGIARGGKNWIAQLENEERARTGIKSLKVGFTRVFGYYIEVTNSNLPQVPQNYIRKQTLVNCERFITPELKERESTILNAEGRINDLEYRIFCEVREHVTGFIRELQNISRVLARLDVLFSFARVAVSNRYCRPKIRKDFRLLIKDGRHPVVEKTLGEYNFVPNDLDMDDVKNRFLLITGPNMAGKSTYMRQAALTVLMAQVGSFVPASSAEIGLVDRIFTRVGAMDDIFSGQSTFMVEMTETANILNNATERSLIILDEIGRGTSTFDGMSIAAAVAEFIHGKIRAKTLFATHYHEITQLAGKHEGMKNLNVAVMEEGDRVTFLHKIVDGPADKSYGIAVAKLAGLPNEVIRRAKEVYNTLEMVENDLSAAKSEAVKKVKGKGKRAAAGVAGERGRDQISLF